MTESEIIRKAVKDSISYAEAIRRIGRAVGSTQYRWLKKKIEELDIDTSHLKGKSHGRTPVERISSENMNNPHLSTKRVKLIVIRENLIPYQCSECENPGEWNGKKLILILDHINGIRNDHRLENLRFLCPNCNSQTDTFCGRNKSRGISIVASAVSLQPHVCVGSSPISLS
jgi:5-methylcytosine-specific restriction endonuclease McrA